MNTEIKQAEVTLTRIKDAYGILVYIDFFREMVRQHKKQAIRRIAVLCDYSDVNDIISHAFSWELSKKGGVQRLAVCTHGYVIDPSIQGDNKMKFEVIFTGEPVKIDGYPVGTDWVDIARKDADAPELPIERIDGYVAGIYRRNLHVELTEEQARDSGLFTKTNTIYVDANEHQFDWAVLVLPEIEKDQETGEVLSVKPVATIDKQAVITTWKNAGYPTDWEENLR